MGMDTETALAQYPGGSAKAAREMTPLEAAQQRLDESIGYLDNALSTLTQRCAPFITDGPLPSSGGVPADPGSDFPGSSAAVRYLCGKAELVQDLSRRVSYLTQQLET